MAYRSKCMTNALNPDHMTVDERTAELARILAAGFLRARCRRGNVPETAPDPPEPNHMATHSGPKKAAGIHGN